MNIDHIHESDDPMQFLQNLPHKVKFVNIEVPLATQMEYYSMLSDDLQDDNNQGVKDIDWEARLAALDEKELKELLVSLSCSEEVESLRALERLENSCPPEIKDFVAMCVCQSRINIESALLGESHAVISSGLGGKDEKIRCFAALATAAGEEWSETQQHLLREELQLVAKSKGAEVESVEFEGRYAKIMLLSPISISPVMIIRSAKEACNELGEFIMEQELLTNMSRLTNEELERIYNKKADDNERKQ